MPGVDQPTEPVSLPAPVVALQDAVEALRGWQPSALDGPQALAATQAVLAAEQALHAVRTRALADIEHRRLHTLAEARSTSAWLREQGATVPPAELALARGLAGLPLVADELAAGRLAVGAASRLQSALGRLRRHLDRPDGRIDGQPAEQALSGVIRDGVLSQVCQARGGFPTDGDPLLLALVERLREIYQTPAGELARLEAAFVLLAQHIPVGQLPGALEASHTERTLKAHERRALYAQTGGLCQAVGCARSGADLGTILHPHHADPWARCGTTSLTDTVLLCESSHADLHEGDRTILLNDGRRLGPDGWANG